MLDPYNLTFCLNAEGFKNVCFRGFFILGQLLHGIGASPILTLGITYIDENVKQIHSSVYNGMTYQLQVIIIMFKSTKYVAYIFS